jgi:hypothetical protein
LPKPNVLQPAKEHSQYSEVAKDCNHAPSVFLQVHKEIFDALWSALEWRLAWEALLQVKISEDSEASGVLGKHTL